MKSLYLFVCVSLLLMSCSTKNTPIDKIEIVKSYYQALNNKNLKNIPNLIADSILLKESDYKMPYDKASFIELSKWDIAFDPTYKIISIEEADNGVKAKVSKLGKRIQFLHERPIITEDFFEFEDNKIRSTGATKYIVFDDKTFITNRVKLRKWIDDNHPELNGFLYDQTPKGAKNYLKAIELFEAKK